MPTISIAILGGLNWFRLRPMGGSVYRTNVAYYSEPFNISISHIMNERTNQSYTICDVTKKIVSNGSPYTRMLHTLLCTPFSIFRHRITNSYLMENSYRMRFSHYIANLMYAYGGLADREKNKLIKRVMHKCMQYLFGIFFGLNEENKKIGFFLFSIFFVVSLFEER